MSHKDHVAFTVGDDGILVYCSIVEKLLHLLYCLFGGAGLLCGDLPKVGEYGEIQCTRIVHKSLCDFLHKLFVGWPQKW